MRAFLISIAALLVLPAAAQATSVRVSGGVLRYTVSPSAQSRMTVTQVPGTIFVQDATATFTATSPCVSINPHAAGCPDSTVKSLSISGGDRNDSFDVSAVGYPARISGGRGDDFIRGGLGNDNLTGSDGNDVLDGGPGADSLDGGRGHDVVAYASHTTGVVASLDGKQNDGSPGERDFIRSNVEEIAGSPADDVLTGSPNADVLRGGAGNDRIDGRAGSDVLEGGPGTDTLDYSSRVLGVNVNLGAHVVVTLGETDRADGFENVIGSRRDDHLTGDAGPNILSGGGGNDVLDGGGGPDALIGGTGFDTATYAGRAAFVMVTLDGQRNDGGAGEGDNVSPSVEGVIGGRGADTLVGNRRANRLRGGPGSDTLRGGSGRDQLEGGTGNDILRGGRGDDFLSGGVGRNNLNGGPGTDTAVAGRRDRVRGCEHIRRR